ncbi:hypothetical protein [Kiloniella sp. EL199]|uniref:hypothetical protein n=1 Tax=Kiloniella sp. EL199 TaxID=2107581 RepID=UPI000EA342BE|nr:hypothetical protein [Kiloniella sp. EL199]
MTCSRTPDHGNWSQKSRSFPLRNYRFQPSELLILELLRYYCQSYANPDSLAWEKAFVWGEKELGPYDGAWVVNATAAFIRTIRNERKTSFEFIVPCCEICRQEICVTELNALWLVQAARAENVLAMETAGRLTLDRAGYWSGLEDLLEKSRHLGTVLNEVFPEERISRQNLTDRARLIGSQFPRGQRPRDQLH